MIRCHLPTKVSLANALYLRRLLFWQGFCGMRKLLRLFLYSLVVDGFLLCGAQEFFKGIKGGFMFVNPSVVSLTELLFDGNVGIFIDTVTIYEQWEFLPKISGYGGAPERRFNAVCIVKGFCYALLLSLFEIIIQRANDTSRRACSYAVVRNIPITTLLIPMMQLLPILDPLRTVTFSPNQTLSPIHTLPDEGMNSRYL